MCDLTDAELAAQARAGDKHAFGLLVERYMPMAQRLARRMVAHVADDLAQEALLQAYLSLDTLRDNARFTSWLYGIVLNVCRSYLREQKIQWLPLDEGGRWLDANPFAVIESVPDEIAEMRDVHQRVLQAVNALSPANRQAVLLFYYDDLSLHETAAILNISENALKARLHRAREHLRTELMSGQEAMRKETTMIQVTFANLIRVNIQRVRDDQSQKYHVMLLLDEVARRVLPIWIGQGEGMALIGAVLYANPNPTGKRPMTWNFVTRILGAAGTALEDVTISTLKEDVFYATARFRSGGTLNEIDARPSDAIPLALLMNRPIYVSKDGVSPDVWWNIPAGMDIQSSLLGAGAAGLTVEPVTANLQFDVTFGDAEWAQLDEATRKQYDQEHQQALREFVFSASCIAVAPCPNSR